MRTICPCCGRETDLVAKSYRQWFTVFFLPVFPVSGSTRFTECSNCRARFQARAEELRARLAAGEQQQNQQAIALYNSLRASPANSVTLNELMQLYAGLREYEQAISAAGQFPQALHNSEQCMTTLGRVYLATNQFPEAYSGSTRQSPATRFSASAVPQGARPPADHAAGRRQGRRRGPGGTRRRLPQRRSAAPGGQVEGPAVNPRRRRITHLRRRPPGEAGSTPPPIDGAFWLIALENLKRWHWAASGALLGAALGYEWIQLHPPDADASRSMRQQQFEAAWSPRSRRGIGPGP